MAHTKQSDPRPRLACEITADRVIAGRAGERAPAVEACTARTLAPGSVAPNLIAANVVDGVALRQTLADALATVGGRSRDVTVLLPDVAARVVLLDFDTLPEKRQDAEAVVRFRLKKSLPFDVDKSAVSFQASRANGTVRVVAAVVLASVLEEYESAFRDAGYQPGVVLPATLAALGPVDAAAPTLVIKVDTVTTSVAIVQNEELLLFRALENATAAAINGERLAEEVYPSLVFFQDTYGTRVERILVGGLVGADEVGEALHAQTGIRPQELVRAAQIGGGSVPRSVFAGIVGALIR
jgi:type IV pilus assembly protein PilM